MSDKLEKRLEKINHKCLLCSNAWLKCYGCTTKKWTKCPSECRIENPERVEFAENAAMFKATIAAYDKLSHTCDESRKEELEIVRSMLDMQDRTCCSMLDGKGGIEERIYRKIFQLTYKELKNALKC